MSELRIAAERALQVIKDLMSENDDPDFWTNVADDASETIALLEDALEDGGHD